MSSYQSAPKGLCAEGRTNDLESILYVIQSAKKFIHIAVMDYEPAIVFGKYTWVLMIYFNYIYQVIFHEPQ